MIKIVYTILVLPQNIQERITFMKMQKKRIVQCGLSLICAFGIALSGMSVHAEEVDSLEDKTSNLQSQLEGINQDLVTISNEIAETEVKIEESNNEVFRLEASLQISRNNEEVQYANMKTRIKYMYENGSDTLLSMVCEAKSMGEFLNRVDFIQNITKYDKDMLENMVKVREGIEEQEAELKSVRHRKSRRRKPRGKRMSSWQKRHRKRQSRRQLPPEVIHLRVIIPGTAVQRGITVLLEIIILPTTIHRIILVPILPIPEAVAM